MTAKQTSDANKQLFQQKLVGFIQDAYAMENEIAQVLQRQIDVTGAHPIVQSKLVQHLAETELQRKRMAQRLEAYGATPSLLMGAATTLLGNVIGVAGAMRPEALSRSLRDDYETEHMEIAMYAQLIAAARAFGDHETVRCAEVSLAEEVAMAEWLFQHLPIALYADLEAEGIKIDRQSLEAARHGPSMHVTFEPLKDVQDARAAHKKQ